MAKCKLFHPTNAMEEHVPIILDCDAVEIIQDSYVLCSDWREKFCTKLRYFFLSFKPVLT